MAEIKIKLTGYETFSNESLDATEDRYKSLKSKLDQQLQLINRERKRRQKIENRNRAVNDA